MVAVTTAETAHILLDNWILGFGPMPRLLTDQGPNFTSETISELGTFLGFDKVVTTSYNPADDPVERRFRHLSNSIAAAHHSKIPWPQVLSSCVYAYNVSYNRMTGSFPFFPWLGRAPRALFLPPLTLVQHGKQPKPVTWPELSTRPFLLRLNESSVLQHQ